MTEPQSEAAPGRQLAYRKIDCRRHLTLGAKVRMLPTTPTNSQRNGGPPGIPLLAPGFSLFPRASSPVEIAAQRPGL